MRLDHTNDLTVGGLVQDAARTFDRATFLECPNRTTGALTYADLGDVCAGVARALAARTSVGDMVMLVMHNSPAMTLSWLGVMAAGRVAVTVNPNAGSREVEHALALTRPAIVIVGDDVQSAVLDILRATGVPSEEWTMARLEAVADDGSLGSSIPIGASMTAEVVFTSGSTGRPKGAALSHRNLMTNSAALVDRFQPDRGDRFLAVCPLFHNSGQVFTTLGPLWSGGITLPVRTELGFARFGRYVDELSISWTLVMNAFLSLCNLNGSGPTAKSLKGVLAGGSVLRADVITTFERMFDVRVFQIYGLTETTSITTCEAPDDGDRRRLGSAGSPLPHVSIRIATDGEVVIRGQHVFVGYVGDPDATSRRVRDDELFSGDAGVIDEVGNLHLVDRIDNMLIVGGENVYPAEVESIAAGDDLVGGCVAVGVDDAVLGTRIVLAYEGSQEGKGDLRRRFAVELSPQKRPSSLISTEELGIAGLPRLANGKIDRPQVTTLVREFLGEREAENDRR